MEYFKSFEFYILCFYLKIVMVLIKLSSYITYLLFKVVLRQSSYNQDQKFPFEMKDVDGIIKEKLEKDFHGKLQMHGIFFSELK